MKANLLKEFIELSKLAGERFDLVQAGGGNSSVKLDDGRMLIKASGVSLSEVGGPQTYAEVNYQLIVEELNQLDEANSTREELESAGNALVGKANIGKARPSIETFLHASMDRFTLHTHPVSVNAWMARADWRELVLNRFPAALLVPYQTPGIGLALAMRDAAIAHRKQWNRNPSHVFLQNHGLITSADTASKAFELTENTLKLIAQEQPTQDVQYQESNQLGRIIRSFDPSLIACAANDQEVLSVLQSHPELLKLPAFCPDTVVYCGPEFLSCPLEQFQNKAQQYLDRFGFLPKVYYSGQRLFFFAPSIRKAIEIQDLLKFHLLSGQQAITPNPLSDQEKYYLTHWEAEKYRQNL